MKLKQPNLWVTAFNSYWSDPQNVIGPPGAAIRRMLKFVWLALAVYVLFWVAGPSQVKSWQLWMEDDALARDIAWAFTFASALCFAVVGYTASESEPIKVPVFLPIFTVESWRVRGLRIETARLHVPNIRVGLGSLLAASLFMIALLGQWNYYLHDGQTTGGTSVAALSGSTDRVGEATEALRSFEMQTAAALVIIDQGIRETSAGSPTGRSRLVAQRTVLMTSAATTRQDLQRELREARAATVTAHSQHTDPRPVDAQVAAATGLDRGLIASLLDLMRSAVVEALLFLGPGLGLAVGASRIGVRKEEFEPEPVEIVAETEPAPEAAPEPAPKRRFVLPIATAEDYAQAAVVGPNPAPAASANEAEAAPAETAEPVSETPEPIADLVEEEAASGEAIDPLLAAELEKDAA